MERRLKMKLNKKTIYKVDTKEKFNAMMKDADEQGFYWNKKGDAQTHPDYWTYYTNETCIRINEQGHLSYGDVPLYKHYWTDHDNKDYELTPKARICGVGPGAVCVEAPNYKEAYQAFMNYINPVVDSIMMKKTNTYTIRVDDKNTTVITPDGKTATAKCHPDDEFDVVEGFRVAMEKIKRQDIKLNQKEREILNAIVVLGGTSFYVNDEHELIVDFDDECVYVSIEEDDFKWCEEYEDYNVKELLEQCS